MTKQFSKFARKNRIGEAALIDAIERAEEGKVDADLRGCLVKLRVPRHGEGRSGGYRTILAYRRTDRAFYLYGFAKNERDNIESWEEERLERYGSLLLGLDDGGLATFVEDGNREINREEGQ